MNLTNMAITNIIMTNIMTTTTGTIITIGAAGGLTGADVVDVVKAAAST